MPVKAHTSCRAARGRPSVRRASRSRGASRSEGGRWRRSLTRRGDLRTDELEDSSDSSKDYMRLGRVGPAISRSQTAYTDSCSESSDQDNSNFSSLFHQYERAAVRQPEVPLASSIGHPKDNRSVRLCSHHRREIMPAARNCNEGDEFSGQRDGADEANLRGSTSRNTGEGDAGRAGGKVAIKSCSPTNPSSSFTRSGEPSSQIAYQAALSPLTSDSNDQSPPAKRRNNRNSRDSDCQSARPTVRDANTSNRLESTRRRNVASCFLSSPSLSPSPQIRQRQSARLERRWESQGESQGDRRDRRWESRGESQGDRRDRRWESRGKNRGESRTRESRDGDRYSKFAGAPFDENHSNLDDIYNSSRRRDCHRQSPQLCQSRNLLQNQRIRCPSQSKRHRNQRLPTRQRKAGDNIYVGNHVKSDVLEGGKLNSLSRLYSMRNQRYENGDYRRVRKSEPERQVLSWEESDREQLSPRQRHLQKQHLLQLQYHQQQQSIQKWKNKARNCRSRQSGVYRDDHYRENIYWNDERGGTSSSRRQSWQPQPASQLSSAWSNDACSVEALPLRSGDARRNWPTRVDRHWSGHNIQLAERPQSECMSSRLEDRKKRHRYGVFDKNDILDDRFVKMDRLNHGSREDDSRRPQTWSLRQTDFEDCDGDDRVQNGRRVKSNERRHWCDGTGRMRETRSRRETIFSCPYVSLALQTKTYECDRCAGYSSYTNNLNSNPNRLQMDDTASQDSWATPEYDRSRDHSSRTRSQKEEGVGQRYGHLTSGRVRHGATSRFENEL